MRKIIGAILLAAVLFGLLNFLYTNMTPEVLNYSMVFRFRVPGLFTLRSEEIPVGFILIASFCAGIIFLSFLQALPDLFRSKSYKEQQKKIRDLEKVLEQQQESVSVERSD